MTKTPVSMLLPLQHCRHNSLKGKADRHWGSLHPRPGPGAHHSLHAHGLPSRVSGPQLLTQEIQLRPTSRAELLGHKTYHPALPMGASDWSERTAPSPGQAAHWHRRAPGLAPLSAGVTHTMPLVERKRDARQGITVTAQPQGLGSSYPAAALLTCTGRACHPHPH